MLERGLRERVGGENTNSPFVFANISSLAKVETQRFHVDGDAKTPKNSGELAHTGGAAARRRDVCLS